MSRMNLRISLILSLVLIALPRAFAQTPAQIKSNEEQIRQVMITMSRQLGVTCNTCHLTENFKSDKKEMFKVAKEHMRLTQLLIDSGMDGKKTPKADCYLCHRGKLQPDYKEKISPLIK